MSSISLKKHLLPVFVVAALCFYSFGANAADTAAKTPAKAEMEQVIHDYILNNPDVILKSVDDYQKKTNRADQDAALEKSKDALFQDSSSPVVGNPNGDVTVIEFMDYNCHYCKLSMPLVLSLLDKDKSLRFVFRDFPILGPSSETAAKWALAANKQKKYFEFHKLLMANKTPISDELLEKTAKSLNLDIGQVKKDIDGVEIAAQIEKNRGLASNLGLSGTPAFIIGSDVSYGALTLEEMEKKIADQRQKAGTAKKPAAK
jgi:protein-disulfide isomerase